MAVATAVRVLLEGELVRDDDVVREQSRGEDVERAVDRVPIRSAGKTGRGADVDGVVDGADDAATPNAALARQGVTTDPAPSRGSVRRWRDR